MIDMNHPQIKKLNPFPAITFSGSQAVRLVNIDNPLNDLYCKGVFVKNKGF